MDRNMLSLGAETLTIVQVSNLLRDIHQLKFISAPLTGVTDHLLTRCGGSHVKPNVRRQGMDLQKSDVLQTAIDVANLNIVSNPPDPKDHAGHNENFDRDGLSLIEAESALTPYGNIV
jgi:hypothetical protein